MTSNDTQIPAKSAAVSVLKVCLIVALAVGALRIILGLIGGESFFHATLSIVPPVSIVAVFYFLVVSRRHSAQNSSDSPSQNAGMYGGE